MRFMCIILHVSGLSVVIVCVLAYLAIPHAKTTCIFFLFFWGGGGGVFISINFTCDVHVETSGELKL